MADDLDLSAIEEQLDSPTVTELVASKEHRSDASLAFVHAQMASSGGVGGSGVTYAKFLKWWQAASKSAGDGGTSDTVLNESRRAFEAADKQKTGSLVASDMKALLETLHLMKYVPENPPQPEPGEWSSCGSVVLVDLFAGSSVWNCRSQQSRSRWRPP